MSSAWGWYSQRLWDARATCIMAPIAYIPGHSFLL